MGAERRTSRGRGAPIRWLGLGALIATLAACGGAMQRPAPSEKAEATPQMPFEGITVVAADPVPAAFVTHYGVNPTIDTAEDAVSRFAADVDTAAYDHARAALADGRLPDPGAVRVEAFLNAFDYGDPPPPADADLALHAEVFPSPHRRGYHVLRVALRARAAVRRTPALVVVVVDLAAPSPLLPSAVGALVEALAPTDRVAVVDGRGRWSTPRRRPTRRPSARPSPRPRRAPPSAIPAPSSAAWRWPSRPAHPAASVTWSTAPTAPPGPRAAPAATPSSPWSPATPASASPRSVWGTARTTTRCSRT
ncbi:MAG: von Willebrand factor type A domain-containing protein [Myxococcales bacterium]|nr:von Willebrand factor type A domain-containing protein [Myxococcales bacterium]